MPKDRPTGTFGGGPLLPRWLLAIFAWRTVREAGAYAYQENRVTGARRAVRVVAGGHCPVDTHWIDGEGWPRPDAPPKAPRSGGRSPGELFVLRPGERLLSKPRIRVPYRREPGPAPIKREMPPRRVPYIV